MSAPRSQQEAAGEEYRRRYQQAQPETSQANSKASFETRPPTEDFLDESYFTESVLDRRISEQAEIIDNSASTRRENRVRIVKPPNEEDKFNDRLRGIFKRPKDPDLIREGVAPLKDSQSKSIPPGARWTKIRRELVSPDALEEAKERYEERHDHLIVLRVLSTVEIQNLAKRTTRIREARRDQHEAGDLTQISQKGKKNPYGSELQKPNEDMQLHRRQKYAPQQPNTDVVDKDSGFDSSSTANRTDTSMFYCGNGEWGCGRKFKRYAALQEHQQNTVTGRRCMDEAQQWELMQEGSQLIPQPKLSSDVRSSLLVDSRLFTENVLPNALHSLDVVYYYTQGSGHYELKNVPETILHDISKRVCLQSQLSEFPLPWKVARQESQTTALLIESDVKKYFVEFLQPGKEHECIYILQQCLPLVAKDELAWMLELSSFGLVPQDLVQILMDESCDEPWSRSSWNEAELGDPGYKYRDPDRTFHQTGCPHSHADGDTYVTSIRLDLPTDQRPRNLRRALRACDFCSQRSVRCTPGATDMAPCENCEDYDQQCTYDSWSQTQGALHQRRVSQVCGLAGIHDLQTRLEGQAESKFDRGGYVEFSLDYFHARVSYPCAYAYMLESIQRVCDAVAGLQEAGLCCSGWTAIVDSSWMPREAYTGDDVPLLHMRQFTVSNAQDLSLSLSEENLLKMRLASYHILDAFTSGGSLRKLFNNIPEIDDSQHNKAFTMKLASLAIQLLSLSLVSFVSSHVGTLELDYLVEDLKQVTLLGCGPVTHIIEMKLRHLTCLEGLFSKPVRVFSISKSDYIGKGLRKHDHEPEPLDWQRHDLRATPEDLVDTFGGALFSITGSVDSDTCLAFSLGGGIVAPIFASASKFHWSPDLCLQFTPRCFKKDWMITVGALSENRHCCHDPHASRNQACTRLQGLGTYRSFWQFSEIEVGFQAGQFFNPTGSANFSRVAGKTLKEVLVDKATAKDLKWPVLESLLGLQISSCTGLARRVPLRVVLADSLIHVIESHMSSNARCAELVNDHKMVEALYASTFQSWLATLPDQGLKDLARDIICGEVVALAKTGIDSRSGAKHLMVAWPSKEGPDACIPIDLGHEANLWAKILQDSLNTATFACVTNACLEDSGFRCSETPTLGSTGIVRMLSTGLCVSSNRPSVPSSAGLAPLEFIKGTTYVIGPEKQRLVATVQHVRESPPGHLPHEPTLMISKSKIPWYIWRRARVLKPIRRLCELGAFVPSDQGRAVSILSQLDTDNTEQQLRQILAANSRIAAAQVQPSSAHIAQQTRRSSSSPISSPSPVSSLSPISIPSQPGSPVPTVSLTVTPTFPRSTTSPQIQRPTEAVHSWARSN